ncbi:MAG: hypothetical protein AAGF11_50050 [Myxococcota bacterium]
MESTLDNLLNLVTLTSDRRIHALEGAHEAAVQLGELDALVARIDAALEQEREIGELDRRWNRSTGTPADPSVASPMSLLDNETDQLLTSIRDTLDAYQHGAQQGTTQQVDAAHFVSVVFPKGVGAITSLPYVQKVAAVERVLQTVNHELSHLSTAFGLVPLNDRLRTLVGEQKEAIDHEPEVLEFATVEAARLRGQHNLLEVVAIILGTFHRHADPDHARAREALLRPILAQDQELRAQDQELRAQDQELRAQDQELRAQDQELRASHSTRRSPLGIDPDILDVAQAGHSTDAPAHTGCLRAPQ